MRKPKLPPVVPPANPAYPALSAISEGDQFAADMNERPLFDSSSYYGAVATKALGKRKTLIGGFA